MKIYAISHDNGKYFVYTCPFLTEKETIDQTLFEHMRLAFTLASKENTDKVQTYFAPTL